MKISRLMFHPLSPLTVVVVPLVLLAVVLAMPPAVYEFYMREPDFAYMNWQMAKFFLANIGMFIAGVCVGLLLLGVPKPADAIKPLQDPLHIWIPLCIALGISFYAEAILLMNNSWLWTAWLSPTKDFSFVRSELNTTGALTEAGTLLAAIIQWTIWKTRSYERAHQVCLTNLRLALVFAIAILLLSALIKLARWELFPYLTAIAISLAGASGSIENISFRKALPKILIGVAGLFIVFNAIAMIRGVVAIGDLIESTMGYTVASFNRLSLMLSGSLNYPYGGSGIYAFRFLANVPILGWFVDVSRLFLIPDAYLAWLSEFDAVAMSGLSSYYIWATAFGYVFIDLGNWVFLYFFLFGVLSAWGWREFWQGKTLGITLYPYIVFCIAFMVGDNFIAYRGIVTLVMVSLALVAYERFFCAESGRPGIR